MFFRPEGSDPIPNSQLDAGQGQGSRENREHGLVAVATVSPSDETIADHEIDATDPFYYTEQELESLQNGEAIERLEAGQMAGVNGRLSQSGQFVPGQFQPGQFVPGQFQPGQFQPGSDQTESLDDRTATEVAAFAIADQLESGTLVDSTFGAESFVLRDPQTKESNADATWMTEKDKWGQGLAWPIVIWMAILHIGAVIAIPFFSWEALVVSLVLHWVGGSVGVCLGFHRMLTHGGFKTYPWVKALLTFAGQTAGEGSADMWVATHRKHHALSDKPGDPHSPHEGSWWSHMLWIYPFKTDKERQDLLTHWAPDMAKDPVVTWVSKHFLTTHFVVGFALLGLGYLYGGWPMALSFMMWGVFIRTVAVLHVTWFVNSASHMFGYRNYETTDDSRNNWWVAILAYGEGWHNNHHAYPRMAVHGHKWWEFDATWQLLRLMRVCGLAWDVVDYRSNKEKRDREAGKK